jgi:uncharacterized protein DUF6884
MALTVIVACGAKKLDRPASARCLYVGPYFKACLAYAFTLAKPKDAFIISAKYGLVGLNDVIEPYDKRLGDTFSVTEFSLTTQAEQLGLLKAKVIVLGGRKYVGLCRKVWRRGMQAPLEGKGGLGMQIRWMKKEMEGRNL